MKKTRLLLPLLLFLVVCTTAAWPQSGESPSSVKLLLTAEPVSPVPGGTVVVRARFPESGDHRHSLRWSWSGEGERFLTRDGNAIQYEARPRPLTVTAVLLNPEGLEAARSSVTVSPASYDLSIRARSPQKSPVLVWDSQTRSPIEKRGTTMEDTVEMRALLSPEPQTALQYEWIPDEGTMIVSQDARACLVRRETPGIGNVALSLLMEGTELGRAEASFDIRFSIEDLRRSRSLEEGWKLWQEALDLRKKGRTDAALLHAERGADKLLDGGADPGFLQGELAGFRAAQAKSLESLELSSVAASLWRDGKLNEALEQYLQAYSLFEHPSVSEDISRLKGRLEERDTRIQKASHLVQEARGLAKSGELNAALRLYEQGLRLNFTPELNAEKIDLEGKIGAREERLLLARSRRATALALEAQGELEGALKKMAESLEIWPLDETIQDQKRILSDLNARQRARSAAEALLEEASELERKGTDGRLDVPLLSQALEKYLEASKLYAEEGTERAVRRVKTLLDRAEERKKQADRLAREGDALEREGHLEEAQARYRRSLSAWEDKRVSERAEALDRRLEDLKVRESAALELLETAQTLERQGRLAEALTAVRQGADIASLDILPVVLRRIEHALREREGRIERAAELSAKAGQHLDAGREEQALMLYLESHAVWPTDPVSTDIRLLRGRIDEQTARRKQASSLYKEGILLEREERLEEAMEKLRASLSLVVSPDVQAHLGRLDVRRSERQRRTALLAEPLKLRTTPQIPLVGERTTFRVGEGPWTTAKDLAFEWRILGNVKEQQAVDGGRAFRFYPADDSPVTATLVVRQPGAREPLASSTISTTAEPWNLRIVQASANATVQSWDDARKVLVEAQGLSTADEVEFYAEVRPLPAEPLRYLWESDADTVLVKARDNVAVFRRLRTGTGKVAVTVKDRRDIPLGRVEAPLLAVADKKEEEQSRRRAQAWSLWLQALALWEEGKFAKAIRTGERASALDPLSSEIEAGLPEMRTQLDRRTKAARLLAEGSMELRTDALSAARANLERASQLWEDAATERMGHALELREREVQNRRHEALRLRTAAEISIAVGDKVGALAQLRNSFLFEPNEAVSLDIAKLSKSLFEEDEKRNAALSLRRRANASIDKNRIAEGIDLYEQSLSHLNDPYLATYIDLLKDRLEGDREFREKAQALRKKGDALMNAKKPKEALKSYKESLLLWHDEELEALVRKREKEQREEMARKLRAEAEALVKRRRPADALEKYKESLALAPNKTAEDFVRKAELEASEQAIRRGDAALRGKKPLEALEHYQKALALTPKNKSLLEKLERLNRILQPARPASEDVPQEGSSRMEEELYSPDAESSNDRKAEGSAQADALIREANELFKKKEYVRALAQYEASYELRRNDKLKEFIERLRTTLRAKQLVQEGNDLYRAQNYSEALEKYQESLKLQKNPDVERFIPQVRSLIQQTKAGARQ